MPRTPFVLFLLFLLFATPASAQVEKVFHGTVLDAVSGLPIEGATVTCGERSAQTDEAGRYAIRTDGFKLAVRAHGYRRSEPGNAFPGEVRLEPIIPKALYLSFYGIGSSVLRDPALDLIASSELNSVVIDIKGDRGLVSYPSRLEAVASVQAREVTTIADLPALIGELRRKGIYTIARIVVFKDPRLAAGRPELAVRTGEGTIWIDHEGLSWVDPFRPEVWDYNIGIAIEAARAGFDEIQFDYVRFPTREGLVFSRPSTEEGRVQAISRFLQRAKRSLGPYNVFLSADIFGYVCWNLDDTAIGQRLEDLSRHVDYLSPMLYPSGFAHGVGEIRNPLDDPYEIIYRSLARARKRSGLDAVRFRPWLQAFRDYAFDRRFFGGQEIRAQVEASENFGAHGWMLWNPGNRYRLDGLKQDEGFPAEMKQAVAAEETAVVADDG